MIQTLHEIIVSALQRLGDQMKHDLPPMLAAVTILLGSYLLARFARWLVLRVFKGIEVDNWLRRSGVSSMIDRGGHLRASRVAAQTAFWGILILGGITALNAIGASITVGIAERVIVLLPRIVAAGAIVLAGLWLAQYLGRSALLWAVNEDMPRPRQIAVAARALVVFTAVVVAAHTVEFAASVFLAGFIIVVGGVVLAAALALGLGARDAVSRHLRQDSHSEERSLWNHL